MPNRMISLERNTNETQIDLTLDLDGTGRYEVDTGCGFLNHMLELFARHGRFDLVLTCHGDVQVDYHHTTEDVGIALGQAFARALGDMRGIQRYGSFYLPMDEALILCAVDLSGRCTLNWDIHCSTEKVGDFDVECAKEFWLGFARSVPATIHFVQFAGENTHHILEACFKGAGHALGAAVKIDEAHKDEIPSNERTAGMIAIIDYGVGNLFSLKSSLKQLGLEAVVTADADTICKADRLILPGVGAFADAMAKLEATGLVPVMKEEAERKPLLGICLGMQMLFDESEEFGLHKGLGLIPGRVVKIPDTDVDGHPQKVPHISWDPLYPGGGRTDFSGTALAALKPGEECYFIHSYEAKPVRDEDRLADTVYGGREICAAASHGSVLGCQFHPEKSGAVGLKIIEEFLK